MIRRYLICSICFFATTCLSSQVVSHTSDYYSKPFYLKLSGDGPFVYTIDGTVPDASSPIFTDSILIEPLTKANLSLIPTNRVGPHTSTNWTESLYDGLHGRIVRFGRLTNIGVDNVENLFYHFGDRPSVPVIDLLIDSSDYFSYQDGIYVPGKHYDDNITRWQPGNFFQRGSDWERNTDMHFSSVDTAWTQSIGVRIHGGASRALPKKSLRLYARKSLGSSKFFSKLFDDKKTAKFDKLILRNAGQDFDLAMMRDLLGQRLCSALDMEYQAGRVVLVFIQGEYWGIHNLRERYDSDFLEIETGEEDVDLIELQMAVDVDEGDDLAYQDFVSFYAAADLTDPESYNILSQKMDIGNYIDHHIIKSFLAVFDWPGNNTKLWRPRRNDGKWRWLMTDLDDGMRNVNFDAFKHNIKDTGDDWPNPAWSTLLFRKLIDNITFRSIYLERLDFLLQNDLSPEMTVPALESISSTIDPYLGDHIARWGGPSSQELWNSEIDKIRDFLENRGPIIKSHFNEALSTDAFKLFNMSVYPNPAVESLVVDGDFPIAKVEVISLSGQIVIRKVGNNEKFQINIGKLPAGVYLCKALFSNGGQGFSTFVKN